MDRDAISALERSMLDIFTSDELGRWLVLLPDGPRILDNIRNSGSSPAKFVHEAVRVLQRYQLIHQPLFWTSLRDAAPTFLKPGVVALAVRFGVSAALPETIPPIPPPPPLITVLLLSASPDGLERLRIDLEFRNIIDKVRGTRFRDLFRFVAIQAARFEDLQTALLEHKPHILHISSHGDDDGSLRFEASDGRSGIVSTRRIQRRIHALRDNLRIVVINACHSHKIAQIIPPEVDVAIGMHTVVADTAAIDFAASFYEAIGFGRTVENAFDIALTAIEDEECENPKLFPPADDNPDNKRRMTLVN